MGLQEKQAISNRVVHFYKNVANLDLNKTYHDFKNENIPKPSIYRYVWMYDTTRSAKLKKVQGLPVSQSTTKVINTVAKMYAKKPSTSMSKC